MQPDIEIYLLSCPTEQIIRWLEQDFSVNEVRTSSDASIKVILTFNGNTIPVTILEKAAGKRFTSVWFDSDQTPWKSDMDCARHAFEKLNCEVRCNYQGWQEDNQDDPDLWWRINDNGEGPYIWR
ncbi:MAG: hypothetical protein CMG93_15145 [Marinomonas sp.]|jgi:hypothetical protein|uniref:hypothetical protein n=1 Tax=Marinomonas communis TaxID=28254 RepID=UPI000C3F136F|nr:hypothetical protein [Marinomonas communis]MAF17290.1 hypothetical protein [Marinomonas sp.]MCC4273411.1 hypothetical protein [Marinomonas communis]MEC8082426.1 hypothetical protein [Pseudomonadota bacterium]